MKCNLTDKMGGGPMSHLHRAIRQLVKSEIPLVNRHLPNRNKMGLVIRLIGLNTLA